MRAVRYHGRGELTVEDMPEPVPDETDVVIAPAEVGLCGTDAHILAGTFPADSPVTLGHEVAGKVIALGSRVTELDIGDTRAERRRTAARIGADLVQPLVSSLPVTRCVMFTAGSREVDDGAGADPTVVLAKLGPMLTFGVVALGVTDVQRAAKFWSAALGYKLREDGFGGWAKVLVPPDGTGTAIALQLSQTPPQDHPRLHFDLHAADAGEQEAEAARLVSLGARQIDWDSYPEDPDFIVLEDPEGNRFCIVDLSYEHA